MEGQTKKSYTQVLDRGTSPASCSAQSIEISQNDLRQPEITFYWVNGDSGDNSVLDNVTYTVTLSDGSTVSATAGFRPVRPNPISFNGKTTTASPAVNVGTGVLVGGGVALNFGSPDSVGITFTVSASTGIGGKFALIQLVSFTNGWIFADATHIEHSTSSLNPQWVLDDAASDNGFPQYGGSASIVESPANQKLEGRIGDDSPAVGVILNSKTASTISALQNFQTYLMYTPPGNSSIWVTLLKMDWGWNGQSSQNNGTWSEPSAITTPMFIADPVGGNSITLPTWAQCATQVR